MLHLVKTQGFPMIIKSDNVHSHILYFHFKNISFVISQTFQRLSKLGITQTRKSFVNLMDDVGGNLIDDLKKLVSTEGQLRIYLTILILRSLQISF